MPEISIIMPAFNAEEYLAESIDSVCGQTFNNWELVITDDGSTDGTMNIIRNYQITDKRIKLYVNSAGKGPASARNNSMNHASGRLIAFLDADDTWHPDKLAKQIAFMEKHKFDFTFTGYNHINDESMFQKKIEIPDSADYATLLQTNVIATSTVIIRRERFSDLRMPDFPRAQDYALWLKLLHQVEQAHGLQEPYTDYRVTSNTGNRRKIFALMYLYKIYTQQEGKSAIAACKLIFSMLIHRIAKYG